MALLAKYAQFDPLGYLYQQRIAKAYIGQDLTMTGVVASDPKVSTKETAVTLTDLSLYYSTNKNKSQVYLKLSGVD